MSEISIALKSVLDNINSISSRPVLLVAISKTKPIDDILEAYKSGQRHFGENYVNELVSKAKMLPNDINWHFVGHLQTNKVKKLLEIKNLYMIESVESFKLAKEINKHLGNTNRTCKILVQVKTSDEETKAGIEPENCLELVESIIENLPALKFSGVMTIGKLNSDPEEDFKLLIKIKEQICEKFKLEDITVSMGMSGDYEKAIRIGSTSVRIGSKIFGIRAKKEKIN